MARRHYLAVLALGLAGSPLAAQQSAAPLATRPAAEWTAPAPPAAEVAAPVAVEPVRLQVATVRSARPRASFQIVTGLIGMLAGGVAGGSVMSRQCEENCAVKAFYGAIGGSSLGFTVGFTLGRAAQGGDPAIPQPPVPVNVGG
jgi:hypothetical protein